MKKVSSPPVLTFFQDGAGSKHLRDAEVLDSLLLIVCTLVIYMLAILSAKPREERFVVYGCELFA
jgi:hypothetical protein